MLRVVILTRLCANTQLARHLSRRTNPTVAGKSQQRKAGNFKPTIRQAAPVLQNPPRPIAALPQDAAATVELTDRDRIIMWTCIASCTLAVVSFTLIKWDVEKRLELLPVGDKTKWLAGEKLDKGKLDTQPVDKEKLDTQSE